MRQGRGERLTVARPARQVRFAAGRAGLDDQVVEASEFEGAAVENEAIARLQPLGVRTFKRTDLAAVNHARARIPQT